MKIQDTRKNILLINPKNGTNILQDYNYVLPFLARKFVASPLPLLTVASLIPERHHVRLVDLNVQELSEEDLSWGELAFITGIELHREEIRKVVKLCKKANLFVVVGGLCATRSHSDIEAVDTFVLGEAEDILGRFFEDYESGRPQHLYQSETYPDLSKSPIPRYDLVDMKNYVNHILQYSRGCCNKCDFCQLTGIYGNKQRSKPVKNFIKELDALYDTGYRGSVMLGDDNFHINGRIKKLLRAIKNWQISHNYPFSLYVQTDISIASKAETMTLMVDAGFDGIQIGIESPSVSSLNSVNKIVNTKFDLVAAARKIHAHGLEIYAAMMVGMDGDPDDIFEMQYEFLMKAGIAQAMISLLDVSSGTTLYEKFKKQGRVLDEFKGFNTGRYHLNYLPKMDPGALLSGYLKLVSETFRPEAYFQRCVRFMRDYKKTSKPGHFSIAEGVKFFLRFLVGNGSLDFTKHFIWFLLRVLFTRPGNFVKAAEIGIKGFQFYKMTGQEIKENSHIEISDDDWLHHFNNGGLSKATRPGFPGGDARLPVNNSVSIRASELN